MPFIGVGQKSVIADLHEPLGQNMEEETPDELMGFKRHLLDCIVLSPVLVGKKK